MKKILGVCAFVLFIMVLGGPAFAQEKMIAPLPPDSGMSQLFGQNQWYSVVFRGNGEAIVNLRATFTNTETFNLATLTFRVPKVDPKDLLAFQVIQEQRPDVYWYGPAKYQKAKTDYSGDTITITLPLSVQPDKSGSILLYYRAFGYAKKDIIGGYRFTFETLKASEPVQELQLGISTDSDLMLRGAQGEVNYRFEDVSTAAKGMMAEAAPAANTRMDDYYQQIGSGQIIKSASNLQALESYTIKGSYADSRLKLYTKELGIGTGVFIAGLLIAVWVIRKAIRSTNAGPTDKTTPIVAMFGLSFLSGILIVSYTILLVFLTRNLPMLVEYDMQLPITILLLIVSLGIYGVLLFGPAVFLGIRSGWGLALGTAGITTVWLIFALFLYVLIGFSRQPGYPPVQIMKGVEQPALDFSLPAEQAQ